MYDPINSSQTVPFNAGMGTIGMVTYWRQAFMMANVENNIEFMFKCLENLEMILGSHMSGEERDKYSGQMKDIGTLIYDSRISESRIGLRVMKVNYNKAVMLIKDSFRQIMKIAQKKGFLMPVRDDPAHAVQRLG